MPMYCRKELVRATEFVGEWVPGLITDGNSYFIKDYTGADRPLTLGDWLVYDPVVGGLFVAGPMHFNKTYRPFPES